MTKIKRCFDTVHYYNYLRALPLFKTNIMSRIKIFFLIILLLLIALTLIAWHFSESSLGPHGGVVKQAGNYYIELKTESPYLYTFLLDKNTKSVSNKDVFCEARFVFSDKTDLNVTLLSYLTDGFSTRMVTEDYSSVQIYFNFHGEAITTQFENENLIASHK